MDINEQTFQMILERFDRVDKDNEAIMSRLAAHVRDDEEVHKVVQKHSSYWGLLFAIGGPIVIGLLVTLATKGRFW